MRTVEEIMSDRQETRCMLLALNLALTSIRDNYQALFETHQRYKEKWEKLEFERIEAQGLVQKVKYAPKAAKSLESMSAKELEQLIEEATKKLEKEKSTTS